ncbi:Hypothetical protein POVN_LOCUS195 [uncultured virus]|nr:Hypothetical protein POVN_LOCUS195 [uncultured virus]
MTDAVVLELGAIEADVEAKVGPEIYIVTVENVGDGSSNWTGNSFPGISVYTSTRALEAALKKAGLGKLAARRAIELGGYQIGENDLVRITKAALNPSTLDNGGYGDWEGLAGPKFMQSAKENAAALVCLEFMYDRGLAPKINSTPQVGYDAWRYQATPKELGQKPSTLCYHTYFRESTTGDYYSKGDPCVRCTQCGFMLEVEHMTSTQGWKKYVSQYNTAVIKYMLPPREIMAERTAKHVHHIDKGIYGIKGTSYAAVRVFEADSSVERYGNATAYQLVGKFLADADKVYLVPLDAGDVYPQLMLYLDVAKVTWPEATQEPYTLHKGAYGMPAGTRFIPFTYKEPAWGEPYTVTFHLPKLKFAAGTKLAEPPGPRYIRKEPVYVSGSFGFSGRKEPLSTVPGAIGVGTVSRLGTGLFELPVLPGQTSGLPGFGFPEQGVSVPLRFAGLSGQAAALGASEDKPPALPLPEES